MLSVTDLYETYRPPNVMSQDGVGLKTNPPAKELERKSRRCITGNCSESADGEEGRHPSSRQKVSLLLDDYVTVFVEERDIVVLGLVLGFGLFFRFSLGNAAGHACDCGPALRIRAAG